MIFCDVGGMSVKLFCNLILVLQQDVYSSIGEYGWPTKN